MAFLEHLDELRTRIIRSLIAIASGAASPSSSSTVRGIADLHHRRGADAESGLVQPDAVRGADAGALRSEHRRRVARRAARHPSVAGGPSLHVTSQAAGNLSAQAGLRCHCSCRGVVYRTVVNANARVQAWNTAIGEHDGSRTASFW